MDDTRMYHLFFGDAVGSAGSDMTVFEHVLFELATGGPGFAVDGLLDGTRLSLPPFLEPRRAEIEAGLTPLASV